MAEGYRDLLVWQRSVQMTVALYRFTHGLPREELYGLSSQLRRAGVSVASNIAEGWGRQTKGEYSHFLGMARGSNFEIQTQLVIARELGLGDPGLMQNAESLSFEVGRMLIGLIKKLQSPESFKLKPSRPADGPEPVC